MKKKTGIARLFEIAGERKGLLILSGILSAGSAACMLIPYLAVYQILSKLLYYNTDLNHIDSNILIHWGWIAFIGLIIGLILLYASLMFSHVAAFRILYGLRIKTWGTSRKTFVRLSEQFLNRGHKKNNGTKY